MSTVCAIVPTFNRKAMLAECLHSLLLQTRPLDRIVVVDDGSTDGTAEMVEERYGSAVTLLRQENSGKSAALNNALAHCEGDYIWFFDDDDLAAAEGCRVLGEALDNAGPEIGFTFGHYRLFTSRNHGLPELAPPAFWPSAADPDPRISAMEDLTASQCASLYRRSAILAAGPFREDLFRSQDYDMLLRITEHYGGIYVPQTVFYQRLHDAPRGPAAEKKATSENHERWLRFDQKFFPALARSPRSFCPSFARALPESVRQRASLLQRAVVFGRRALWEEALPPLAQACRAGGDEHPLPEEERLAMRLIPENLPASALPLQGSVRRELAQLRHLSPYGASIMRAVAILPLKRARSALGNRRYADAIANIRAAGAAVSWRRLAWQGAAKLRGQALAPPDEDSSAPYNTILPQEREELAALLAAARRGDEKAADRNA